MRTWRWATALLILISLSATAQSTQPAPAESASIEVLFTPEEDVTARLVKAIGQAKREVLVQSYFFTNRRIANALLRAHRAGKTVQVINDQTAYEQGSAVVLSDLNVAGIAIYLDAQHATAHNKIMIIDGESEAAVLVTGSFNFTVAAQKSNAENLLLISGKPDVIRAYRNNWLAHQAHSVRLQ
jgi:phosphatidylserine/phosphatidylglycerophosphate/cardiolipin synthase-like enzyme